MDSLKEKLKRILSLYMELLECTREENHVLLKGELNTLPHLFGRKLEAFESIFEFLPEQLDMFECMEELFLLEEEDGDENQIFFLVESCRWVIREILALSKKSEDFLICQQRLLEEGSCGNTSF